MQVTQAPNAAEALTTLQREPFDVLISDVDMPGRDGMALLRKVRRLPAGSGGRIPALTLTLTQDAGILFRTPGSKRIEVP
jgi:two-component system chemotaxis response regulator CheY